MKLKDKYQKKAKQHHLVPKIGTTRSMLLPPTRQKLLKEAEDPSSSQVNEEVQGHAVHIQYTFSTLLYLQKALGRCGIQAEDKQVFINQP